MRHVIRLPATFKHAYDLRPAELRWWDGDQQRLAATAQMDAVRGDDVEMRLELFGTGRLVYAQLRIVGVGDKERSGARTYELEVVQMAREERAALQAWMDERAPARPCGDAPTHATLPRDPTTWARAADGPTRPEPARDPTTWARLADAPTRAELTRDPRTFPYLPAPAPPAAPRDPPPPSVLARDPLTRPLTPRAPTPSRPPPPSLPPPERPWVVARHSIPPPTSEPPSCAPDPQSVAFPAAGAPRAFRTSWPVGLVAVRWRTVAAFTEDWEAQLRHHGLLVPADGAAPGFGARVDLRMFFVDGSELRVGATVAGPGGAMVLLQLALTPDDVIALERRARHSSA